MKSIVVFESMFGNTERVARAIAEGLQRCGDVELVEVGDADPSLGSSTCSSSVDPPMHSA